jgi:CarD family transcriptional regulator
MYERARVNLISEIEPALKVTREEAEAFLDEALAKGVLKPKKVAKKAAAPKKAVKKTEEDEEIED